jgi:hypothetical protein
VTPDQWRDQLRRDGCAMPLGGQAVQAGGWGEDLECVPLGDGAISPVWLVLPRGSDTEPLLRHTLQRLRTHPALTG